MGNISHRGLTYDWRSLIDLRNYTDLADEDEVELIEEEQAPGDSSREAEEGGVPEEKLRLKDTRSPVLHLDPSAFFTRVGFGGLGSLSRAQCFPLLCCLRLEPSEDRMSSGNAVAPTDTEGDALIPENGGEPKKEVNWGSCQQNWMALVALLRGSFLSVLLVFIPLGIAAYQLDWGNVWVFWLNFMAIIPLAWLIGESTEALSEESGPVVGGLLNATFGNVVEMILCGFGIYRDEILVVQCTLMGSILSNLLLVLGCSFWLGGMKQKLQQYNALGAVTSTSLLMLSCLCLTLPTMYASILQSESQSELNISRILSIALVISYIQYLYFQMVSHYQLFEKPKMRRGSSILIRRTSDQEGSLPQQQTTETGGSEDEEGEAMPVIISVCILGVSCLVVSLQSEYLISSIQGVVDDMNLSKEFIGIILLPIIGNAAEHYSAVVFAVKDNVDLALGVAVGSSIQMALLVTPVTVLIGWAMGKEMTLNFHPFQAAILVFSTLITTGILQDGVSHWLEGSMLMTAYFAVALIYYFEEPYVSGSL
uniref:Sodium/calcium exchanger membrane region domain-containing protein n=1 Tax=Chromera velia CCMP2878 TaxID=1169474 RepID=A0A0G4GZY9_9ALVE|eukprot:Cvel_24120.t1-p1 / transcript=Cvel_24120.t1 / gene=Cvel_24120 / organism=Chromera_velia_CCMP2878 / gene_product=Vacuolar calcium ion transporter, putative / transcript_product=Vacuolar calcium ion transporter, putative / location=Cvel_scaffold2570:4331-23091(-) / protein_length=536 / sequence_SO=supercontig / SO=protein_coding / is_pseudo=false